MSGVVEGKTLEEAVDRGQWLAALGIRELGPSYVFPAILSPRESSSFAVQNLLLKRSIPQIPLAETNLQAIVKHRHVAGSGCGDGLTKIRRIMVSTERMAHDEMHRRRPRYSR